MSMIIHSVVINTHTYICTDNELPDYIMVMLANKKTMNQISTDLQLFLGENTDQFIDWSVDTLMVMGRA